MHSTVNKHNYSLFMLKHSQSVAHKLNPLSYIPKNTASYKTNGGKKIKTRNDAVPLKSPHIFYTFYIKFYNPLPNVYNPILHEEG